MTTSREDSGDEKWMEEIEIEWARDISDDADPLAETSNSFGKRVTEFETIELVPEKTYVISKVAEDECLDEVEIEFVREDSIDEVDPLGDIKRKNYDYTDTDRLAELIMAHGGSVGNLGLESSVLFLNVYGTETENLKNHYACRLCDYESSKRNHLHNHCRTHHDEDTFKSALHAHLTPQPKGELCGQIFSHLQAHRRKKGQFQNKLSPEKQRKTSLRTATAPNSAGKNSVSPEMRKNVTDEVNLIEKPYACKSCEYRSCRKYDLKKHELNHTTGQLYHCTICSFKCKRRGYLNVHTAIHLGQNAGLHECSICHYKTQRAANLKVHVKTHIDERPFACAVCQKKFSQAGNLKIHTRVHTGEKPYHCNVCGLGFSQITSRQYHEKGCTKKCDICKFKCTKIRELNEHKKTHSLVRIVRLVPTQFN